MSCVPAGPGGLSASICVSDKVMNAAALFGPKRTLVADSSPVPVMITQVPPAAGPVAGVMLVIAT